jgi:hypothetical protein
MAERPDRAVRALAAAGLAGLVAGGGLAWRAWRQESAPAWAAAAVSFAAGLVLSRQVTVLALRPPVVSVTFDDDVVVRRAPGGKVERIRWDELGRVEILTTEAGPRDEDVFWLLASRDGALGCAVPASSEGMPALLERLQLLPGFDNQAVIEAMACATRARFVVWAAEDTGPPPA